MSTCRIAIERDGSVLAERAGLALTWWQRFRGLMLAWKVLELGGTAGAAFVGSNEQATRAFLDRKIDFNSIYDISARVLQTLSVKDNPTLDEILAAHKWAKAEAERWISRES